MFYKLRIHLSKEWVQEVKVRQEYLDFFVYVFCFIKIFLSGPAPTAFLSYISDFSHNPGYFVKCIGLIGKKISRGSDLVSEI